MADPKQAHTNEPSETDWAERLRASMNRQEDGAERPPAGPAAPGGSSGTDETDDDIARLLRDQLSKMSAAPSAEETPAPTAPAAEDRPDDGANPPADEWPAREDPDPLDGAEPPASATAVSEGEPPVGDESEAAGGYPADDVLMRDDPWESADAEEPTAAAGCPDEGDLVTDETIPDEGDLVTDETIPDEEDLVTDEAIPDEGDLVTDEAIPDEGELPRDEPIPDETDLKTREAIPDEPGSDSADPQVRADGPAAERLLIDEEPWEALTEDELHVREEPFAAEDPLIGGIPPVRGGRFAESRAAAGSPLAHEGGAAEPDVPPRYADPDPPCVSDDILNGRPPETAIDRHLFRQDRGDEREDAPLARPAPFGRRSEEGAGAAGPEGLAASAPDSAPPDPLRIGLDGIFEPFEPEGSEPSPARGAREDGGEARGDQGAVERAYEKALREDEEADRDTELYVHMGYESELLRSGKRREVERMRETASRNAPFPPQAEAPSIRAATEYGGVAQTPSIERAYRSAVVRTISRLCLTALGAFAAVLLDLLPTIVSSEAEVGGPWLYPAVGLGWLVLVSLLNLPRLARGFRGILRFERTRYSVAAAAAAVSLVHGVIVCVAAGCGKGTLPLYGGAALCIQTLAVLADLLTVAGERKAFEVVSAGKPVFVPAEARRAEPDEEGSEREGGLRIRRAGGLAGYFAETNRYCPYMGRLNYLMPAALLFALVTVCVGAFVQDGWDILTNGLPVFTSAYLLALPASYALAVALPMWRANRLLRRRGCAVVGSAAPAAYAGEKGQRSLLLADGDVLRAVRVREITLREDRTPDRWRRTAHRVFTLLHMPLCTESRLYEGDLSSLRTEILENREGLLRLRLIDDRSGEQTEVAMGAYGPLAELGIRLPKREQEPAYRRSRGSRTMYVAVDGRFRIAYSAEYRVSAAFADALPLLRKRGVRVTVGAFDPLVTRSMLRTLLPRVAETTRPRVAETRHRTCGGGLIATGQGPDLIRPLEACVRIRTVMRTGVTLGWIGVASAFGLSIALVLTDTSRLLSPALTALVPLLDLLLTVAAAGLSVNGRALRLSGKRGKPSARKKA